jgi:hypothetical protein
MSPVLYVMLKSSLAPLMLVGDLLLMTVCSARIIFRNTEPSPRQIVQPSSHAPGSHGYQNCEKHISELYSHLWKGVTDRGIAIYYTYDHMLLSTYERKTTKIIPDSKIL